MARKKKQSKTSHIPEFVLQPKQFEYVQATESIVFFGGGAGGGKTFGSMLDNLQGIHDPLYFSVFFRTTTVEITKGLWPEAKRLYLPYLTDEKGKFKGMAKINEQEKTITFPSGARTTFAYLSNDKDADSWYGTEIAKIYFEEAQFRSQYQFDVLKSRNRSMADVVKGIRCTLNPSPTSFIYDWVKPYLDEEDYPVHRLSGKTRYYVVVDGVLHTSWEEQELKDTYGKDPETYTYIPATLDDNKKLDLLDPSYRKKLDSMPENKRKQLLKGCWGATEDSGLYFRRESVHIAERVPFGAQYVRGWDMASSEITANNPTADPSMGLKFAKCKQGYYYICGMNRFFKRVGARNQEIINTAHRDTAECHVVTAVDPAAAGRTAFEYFAKEMSAEGFVCRADPMPINASKVNKAEPFFAACENGLVYVVESEFSKEDLQLFYRELESFNGERSTANRHDESVDCAAMCFNYLAKKKIHTVMRIPDVDAPSIKKQYEL